MLLPRLAFRTQLISSPETSQLIIVLITSSRVVMVEVRIYYLIIRTIRSPSVICKSNPAGDDRNRSPLAVYFRFRECRVISRLSRKS